MSDDGLITRFATYASELEFELIPPAAVHMVRRLLFDTIATALGGYQTPLGRRAADFAATGMPGDAATLIGDGRRASLEGATFGNAVMAKILGMDDSHRTASHIAAQVIPAALAAAEQQGTSGKEFICAVVAAYDLAVRIGHAVRMPQRARGLDVKGTVGPMAAAVAAARCAGLDAREMAYGIGLAADMASGTEQYVYDRGDCDTKDLIAGFAARNGVLAARLAANGFHGPLSGLDGEYGFFRAFGDGYDPALFDDLGRDFAILSTGFKPHGGCRHTHQAVDCVQQIRAQEPVDPGQIERVTIGTYRYATEPSFRVTADPGTRELAGLSIRVATAVALVRGSAWPDDFEHWDDPAVRRLRQATDVVVDPTIEAAYPGKNGCTVTLQLANGRLLRGHVAYAKGEPEFPMDDDELVRKFQALTQAILPDVKQPAKASRGKELFSVCMALAEAPDLHEVVSLASALPTNVAFETAL